MPEQEFYVEIVQYEDDKVIEQRGPFSRWRADKIDDGLNINLNHDRYYTRVVEASNRAADVDR